MMRSLFSGVSGLKNHQTRMDVIGNNISNVNTVGYKKSRVTFQDTLSQTLRGASSATTNRAGTNPMQVGLGMSLASIDVIHGGSSPQRTGKNTDLSIENDGYFLLRDGQNIYYTRAGNFDFDNNMTFYHTSTGMVVQGYLADSTGYIDTSAAIQDINLSAFLSTEARATTEAHYSKNLDSRAVIVAATPKTGTHDNTSETVIDIGNVITDISITIDDGTDTHTLTEGDHYTVDYSAGKIIIKSTAPSGNYNVTYTNAHWQVPTTFYDSQGKTHTVITIFTKVGDNTWDVDTVYDGIMQSTGEGTLEFDTKGNLVSSSVSNLSIPAAGGVAALNVVLKFDNMTQYAGEFTAWPFSQDGYAAGNLIGVTVDTTGTLTGSFDNGQSRKLAQIALATFSNPSGLLKVGNSLFDKSNNSGTPNVGVPGEGGRGTIQPESLEMSNVDLSEEFVDMIITQRGFQANSRVITTSDQILEEVVNLRR